MDVDGLNLFIMLALAAGHAALLIAIINRLHARPWPRSLMDFLRQVHDVLLVALPALFVWRYGLSEPRLVYGGAWHLLPLPVLAYLAACGTTTAALLAVVLVRCRARPPHCQLSNHSSRIDIARRLGFRPVGSGPFGLMTRLPRNECFQLEVSDKEFLLPRLPIAWDGMSILHLSDLHLIGTIDRPYFEQVIEIARTMPSDLVAFTGDLLDREELIDWLPDILGRLSAPLGCFFVLGNHDWFVDNTSEIRQRMESLGWRGVAGECELIVHRDHRLAVSGVELPWMGTLPDLSTVPSEAFRLLLSHTPDNLPWARRERIDLMLAGHNHGGQIRLPGFGPVYVPSAYGGRYAGGAFSTPPTMLYVSRGISGRHPLRWNCPPELTRLVLRAEGKCAT